MTAAATRGRGGKPTTGRYETRELLCEAIWDEYRKPGASRGAIARWLKVSPGVVNAVVENEEGKPEGWRLDPRPGWPGSEGRA